MIMLSKVILKSNKANLLIIKHAKETALDNILLVITVVPFAIRTIEIQSL